MLNDVGTVTAGEVFLKAARSIQREVRCSLEQAVLTFKIADRVLRTAVGRSGAPSPTT